MKAWAGVGCGRGARVGAEPGNTRPGGRHPSAPLPLDWETPTAQARIYSRAGLPQVRFTLQYDITHKKGNDRNRVVVSLVALVWTDNDDEPRD